MKYFYLVFLVFCLKSVSAQNGDVLEYFNASKFNEKVLLTWSITQGNTCNGIKILRSIDSVNFSQISSIEGVCGSTQASVSYDFTDLDPVKNERNYYRLQLGSLGFSWIVSVEVVDLGMNKSLVRPNPLMENSELRFDNEANFEVELKVYSSNGILVHKETSSGELILLYKTDYSPGLHYYTIRSEELGSLSTGKFVVP